MFEKSNLIPAQAIRNRGYTDKTHLRGLKTLVLCWSAEADFACVVANYIRPKLFKHPLRIDVIKRSLFVEIFQTAIAKHPT
ncbi:hypothetical protein LC608_26520 [Nostoc sp. XA010]|uniref:hypothetical protein n=1 Tax=Nostoc sp. XA010 TaxID=2780407 RepID=UPI001E46A396|nr:hypothetical protein [Nostoc sp. XA010]MCC5660469.1 hypothetical protein [Nostoc sp. XA010]